MDTNKSPEIPLLEAAREIDSPRPSFAQRLGDKVLGFVNRLDLDSEAGNEQPFARRVERFLQPDSKIEASEQLSFVSEFWAELGYEVPELSDSQLSRLYKNTAANPSFRIVPSPLLSNDKRQTLMNRAYQFSDSPIEGLRHNINDRLNSLIVKYKTSTSDTVDRQTYINSLLASGQSVEAKDGTNWTFLVMDIRVNIKRKRRRVAKLHELVEPAITPESLIAVRLLHLANNTPSNNQLVDIANEAIYKSSETDDRLTQVIGVEWNTTTHQIELDAWCASQKYSHFTVRGAVNGLS